MATKVIILVFYRGLTMPVCTFTIIIHNNWVIKLNFGLKQKRKCTADSKQ